MEGEKELSVYFLLFLGTIGMFILAVSILVFYVLYQKRLQQQQQNMWDMQEEFQKDLLRSNIETQEQERMRIARDLHDNIGSSLASLKLFTSNLASGVSSEKTELASVTMKLVDETLDDVRTISYQLLPPGIKEFGIRESLESLCSRLRLNTAIDFSVHSSGWIGQSFETEIALYRVIQELISNTIKHSGATRAEIVLGSKDHRCSIIYRDNGRGFDPLLMKEVKSLGLKNIYSRISVMGGSVDHRYTDQQMETLITL